MKNIATADGIMHTIKWIRVKEMLPEPETPVLVFAPSNPYRGNSVRLAYRLQREGAAIKTDTFYDEETGHLLYGPITHWTPINISFLEEEING